ncbi:nuclear pore complex protein NUP1 isoform X2 [Impatiens glandulifera]|uniref:nuclear pore complex protein NUP1 isoform X2 n=1 Tax=Impatiens glandulifera TaxID=253017 RepID=UPI001FB10C30|nr:nuclear pore complex protein NUP1 isoform X2 [Impatiens glandulifera]
MENNELETPSRLYEGSRGAGGKLKRQSARKPPSTPYDRPKITKSEIPLAKPRDNSSGWLSKLVDPAYRLLAGGANKILPSFFTKSPLLVTLPAPTIEDHVEWATDNNQTASIDNQENSLNLDILPTTDGASLHESGYEGESDVSSDQLAPGTSNLNNEIKTETEFTKIEQLFKGKVFSRDEIQRLSELLKSRVDDVEPETNTPRMYLNKAEGHENLKVHFEEKPDYINRAALEASPSRIPINVVDVGASPVDIAKAYMGSRVSRGRDSRNVNMLGGEEGALLSGDVTPFPMGKTSEFVSKPFPSNSPSNKSLVCWPGSMPRENHSYPTPQSASGRYGHLYSPRSPYTRNSPYARTAYSQRSTLQSEKKSSSKFVPNSLVTHETRLSGQPIENAPMNMNGSAGPIRRSRQKSILETPSRGFLPNASRFGLPQGGDSSFSSKYSVPVLKKKNLEVGASSSSSSFRSTEDVDRSKAGHNSTLRETSNAVRTILEHLDRTTPTLAEKSTEMKISMGWRNTPTKEASDLLKENDRTTPSNILDFNRNGTNPLADKGSSVQRNEDKGKSIEITAVAAPEERRFNATADFLGKEAEASQHKGKYEFPNNSLNGTNKSWNVRDQQNNNGREIGNVSKPPPPPTRNTFQLLGTKPSLSSISVNKTPGFQNNSSGFTFPVCSSSSQTCPEPPTPTVLPSTILPQVNNKAASSSSSPSYSFGTKKRSSSPALVFSFPSTISSSSTQDENSGINYNFGSDKKNRISFSSFGKDSICSSS